MKQLFITKIATLNSNNIHGCMTLHEACMSALWENKTNIEDAGRSQLHNLQYQWFISICSAFNATFSQTIISVSVSRERNWQTNSNISNHWRQKSVVQYLSIPLAVFTINFSYNPSPFGVGTFYLLENLDTPLQVVAVMFKINFSILMTPASTFYYYGFLWGLTEDQFTFTSDLQASCDLVWNRLSLKLRQNKVLTKWIHDYQLRIQDLLRRGMPSASEGVGRCQPTVSPIPPSQNCIKMRQIRPRWGCTSLQPLNRQQWLHHHSILLPCQQPLSLRLVSMGIEISKMLGILVYIRNYHRGSKKHERCPTVSGGLAYIELF